MESYNSFPASLNREVTFDKWYYEIRVDLLTDDELAFELAVRDIAVDKDRSQRRRCLRARLKVERHEGSSVRTLKSDPKEDIEQCRAKLAELEAMLREDATTVCKDRLLHLGARIKLVLCHAPQDIKDELIKMFVRVTDHLYFFYYKSVRFEHDVEGEGAESIGDDMEDIPTLEDILRETECEVELVKVPRLVLLKELERRLRAEQAEESLTVEVANLSSQLQKFIHHKETWNQQVQTDEVEDLVPRPPVVFRLLRAFSRMEEFHSQVEQLGSTSAPGCSTFDRVLDFSTQWLESSSKFSGSGESWESGTSPAPNPAGVEMGDRQIFRRRPGIKFKRVFI